MNLSNLPPQLTRNFWKKFAVFLLASLLWFYVRGEQLVEKGITIPITVVTADGMTVVETSTKTLQVILSGPQERMETIQPSRISAKIDLHSHTKPISISVPVHKGMLRIPRGVDAVRFYPSHVLVTVDSLVEKTLPVAAAAVGKPAEGFRLAKITTNPTVITLKGPKSLLEKTAEVATAPVDLTGKNRSFLEKVALKWDPVWADPENAGKGVEVLVSLEQHLVEKEIGNVDLLAIRGFEDKRVLDSSVKKVSLWVQGTEEMVKLVKSEDISAFVEVGRLSAGKFELPVQVNLPKGLKLVKVEPSQVEVRLAENN